MYQSVVKGDDPVDAEVMSNYSFMSNGSQNLKFMTSARWRCNKV